MAGKTTKPQPPKTTPLLDERQKRLMIAVLIQNRTAFEKCQAHLRPEVFGQFDLGLRLVWVAAIKHYEQYGNLPEYELLQSEVLDACNSDTCLLSDVEKESVEEFVNWAYTPGSFRQPVAESTQYAEWAVQTVQRYLKERLMHNTRNEVFADSQVAVNIPEIFQDLQNKAAVIDSISGQHAELAFPTGWDRTVKLELFSTGLGFIDHFTGGNAPGEVYGLMGPFGSCKTTLVTMLAVEACLQFDQMTQKPDYDGRVPLVFVFSYESPPKEMRSRVISYAAKIHRDTLEHMTTMEEDMSRTGSLKPYEKKIFARELATGELVPGEYERTVRQMDVLNRYLVLVDMSGETRKGAGYGGVTEIVQIVNQEIRRRGNARCGLVLLDYAGVAVDRYMETNNIPNEQRHALLKSWPHMFGTKLAKPYQTPVYLIHQLTGAANARGASVVPHHTDAQGCKNFAENMDFCFVIGTPDEKNQVAAFGCTKHRRKAPRMATLIKIAGQMNRVICVDNQYAISSNGKGIVAKKDQDAIVGVIPTGAEPTPGDEDDLGIDLSTV